MSILNTPQLTTAQKQGKLKAMVTGSIRNLYAKMLAEFNADYNAIWNNADGLSQAEALAALGTDAAEVFRLASMLQDAVNAAKPNSITATHPAVTVANDGTVSLTA